MTKVSKRVEDVQSIRRNRVGILHHLKYLKHSFKYLSKEIAEKDLSWFG